MATRKQSLDRKEQQQRQQAALAAAKECAGLLKERFGTRTVIPFGSVVGEGS